jgi:hypothetical protein
MILEVTEGLVGELWQAWLVETHYSRICMERCAQQVT